MPQTKVAVALSGGLDSSVAALLLKASGYEVMGLHMRLRESPAFDDQAHRAEDICRILDIPYHQIDLQQEFERQVVGYFCREYGRGRTPNPCVACNQHMKFGCLLDQALFLGADYLATGHYARVEHRADGYHLLKAADGRRDQSYFLYTLTQQRLRHTLFPLGAHGREDVSQMALRAGLPVAARSSQDLCFISERNYDTFLSQRFPATPGDIVDTEGRRLGQHRGTAFYTIGQRHGLRLAWGKPLHVIRIEAESNRIVLGPAEDLYSQKLTAGELNWISGNLPREPVTSQARIRYKSKEAEARLSFTNQSVEVYFPQPQKAVTPGQAIVFYSGDEVLGGGTISETQR
jgi:tRNA-uridine 2-sulfurtransferase